jgi:hypothetical protein
LRVSMFSCLNRKKFSRVLKISEKDVEDLRVITDKQIRQLGLLQVSLQNISGDVVEESTIKETICRTENFLYKLKGKIKVSIPKKELE